MDQNNIILILLLIAVLVAFYAIYLAMENSKRIKKVSLEMVDLAKLIQESSSLPPQHFLQREDQPPAHPFLNQREDLDEYPTLDEVNTELNEKQVVEEPLDENLKNQINNLDNLDEEALLNLERQLDSESRAAAEANEVEDGDEADEVEDEASEADEVANEVATEEVSEAVNEASEAVDEASEAQDGGEESSNEYPVLGELTEDGLNELNCEELREICKREELRTRGRKAELVERIIKKRDALA